MSKHMPPIRLSSVPRRCAWHARAGSPMPMCHVRRPSARAALYRATRVGVRRNSVLHAFYERLVARARPSRPL